MARAARLRSQIIPSCGRRANPDQLSRARQYRRRSLVMWVCGAPPTASPEETGYSMKHTARQPALERPTAWTRSAEHDCDMVATSIPAPPCGLQQLAGEPRMNRILCVTFGGDADFLVGAGAIRVADGVGVRAVRRGDRWPACAHGPQRRGGRGDVSCPARCRGTALATMSPRRRPAAGISIR